MSAHRRRNSARRGDVTVAAWAADHVRRMTAPASWLLAIVLATTTVTSGCADEREPTVQGVVLISIDTLRADALGAYDPTIETTPNTDRLAAEGLVFTDAISQAVATLPSHKSMFHSLYPAVLGVSLRDRGRTPRTSPVQALRDAGITTAAFVDGGQMRKSFNVTRGFGRYTDNIRDLALLRRRATRWIDAHREERFFLFLHTYRVHCPYWPPESYRERHAGWYEGDFWPAATCQPELGQLDLGDDELRFLRALYQGEVEMVDEFIGRLRGRIETMGLADRVAIILMSDHGEAFGEQDHIGHNRLGEEQIRVPLIVDSPGIEPARITAPVQNVDIMPTVFGLLAVEPPYAFVGTSLLDVAERPDQYRDRTRFAWNNQFAMGVVRRGALKLIYGPRRDPSTATLLDLDDDPEESRDLAAEHPELVTELIDELLQAMDRTEYMALFRGGSGSHVIDPETAEDLRALGYIR